MFMCGSMMQNNLLRVFMWALGLSATIGNLLVLFLRITTKTKNDVQVVQAIFVGNLAFSDLLMGIYMFLLAAVDAYYGDKFYKVSDLWRVSSLCKVASFLNYCFLGDIVVSTCRHYHRQIPGSTFPV